MVDAQLDVVVTSGWLSELDRLDYWCERTIIPYLKRDWFDTDERSTMGRVYENGARARVQRIDATANSYQALYKPQESNNWMISTYASEFEAMRETDMLHRKFVNA